eukprot:CAMPEP_0175659772 /NCGR_PEP_ID=MMETSP0097-20121207/14104_1 /TAXON_ID=311494 /ORGANISM="Alexandrium monilatum, Strain CCMP3105" /LENGTH=49 /DNA_ID= /DNA_START= /DNA_END= /DNA_ORIENTATION=
MPLHVRATKPPSPLLRSFFIFSMCSNMLAPLFPVSVVKVSPTTPGDCCP